MSPDLFLRQLERVFYFLCKLHDVGESPTVRSKCTHLCWTNRKRVRWTQGNFHCSRSGSRFCSILYIRIIHISSMVFLRYMLQPIRIRLTTLSCFETNVYLRVFLRTHASKPVSVGYHKIICKQTLLALCLPHINLEIPANSAWPATKTHTIRWGKRFP